MNDQEDFEIYLNGDRNYRLGLTGKSATLIDPNQYRYKANLQTSSSLYEALRIFTRLNNPGHVTLLAKKFRFEISDRLVAVVSPTGGKYVLESDERKSILPSGVDMNHVSNAILLVRELNGDVPGSDKSLDSEDDLIPT